MHWDHDGAPLRRAGGHWHGGCIRSGDLDTTDRRRPDLAKWASSTQYVTATAPPFLIFNGDQKFDDAVYNDHVMSFIDEVFPTK
ncbi:hypothetical protein Mal15_45490 [Stieleria maiorica]|uniref:Uncharacterized protein n=1 Tax=Stieleria maiorica TaxID=2795974 RepID=A0A5B9MH86_9BACT|nr:hypothetical protein Mal15_45490 [Stieleria maiorica]